MTKKIRNKRLTGPIKSRSQTYNPLTRKWTKRNTTTGRFMDVKNDGKPFKNIRKE